MSNAGLLEVTPREAPGYAGQGLIKAAARGLSKPAETSVLAPSDHTIKESYHTRLRQSCPILTSPPKDQMFSLSSLQGWVT